MSNCKWMSEKEAKNASALKNLAMHDGSLDSDVLDAVWGLLDVMSNWI